MDKDLRKIIIELDAWLSNLNKIMQHLRKSMIKEAPKVDSVVKIHVDALANTASMIGREIGNQKKSLKILQRTPPGMITSVIDFLYNVTVDPSADTQRQQYFNKIEKLDQGFNKDYKSVEHALNVPEFRINEGVRNAVHSFTEEVKNKNLTDLEDSILRDRLSAFAKPIADNLFTPRLLRERLGDLQDEITKALNIETPEQAQQAVINLLIKLEQAIKDQVPNEKHQLLQSGFITIRNLIGDLKQPSEKESYSLRETKIAEDKTSVNTQFHSIISNFQDQLSNLGGPEGNSFGEEYIRRVEEVASQLKEDAGEQKIALVERYITYVKGLLSEQNGSLRKKFLSLMSNINNLEDVLREQASSVRSINQEPQQLDQPDSFQEPSDLQHKN